MISPRYCLLALALLAGCAMQAEQDRSRLETDLETMLSWFPGEYDNQQQVLDARKKRTPTDQIHRHTHHLFQPVSIPFIDSPTLYAQQYQHFDPDDLYRQRLYVFDVVPNKDAIRLTIYTPKNSERLRDLHQKPELAASLKPTDFVLKPGCEVYWRRVGDEFHGFLEQDACHYYSERFQSEIYLNETLILRRDALLLDDTAVDSAGNAVFGSAGRGSSVNLKVR